MTYDPKIHHRRSIRLKDYDYALPGAYFVTICTHNRECLFGEVLDGEMRLNDIGRLVEQGWRAIPEKFPHVVLDVFVVMPNHVHGIIITTDCAHGWAGTMPAPTGATTGVPDMVLGDVIGAYKSWVTVEYIRGVKLKEWPLFDGYLWQCNFFEHVVRDETDLERIREYITHNPTQWALDCENPANAGVKGRT